MEPFLWIAPPKGELGQTVQRIAGEIFLNNLTFELGAALGYLRRSNLRINTSGRMAKRQPDQCPLPGAHSFIDADRKIRYQPRRPPETDDLRRRLRDLANERRRFGYPRLFIRLCQKKLA